jgi:hypothetical protein
VRIENQHRGLRPRPRESQPPGRVGPRSVHAQPARPSA